MVRMDCVGVVGDDLIPRLQEMADERGLNLKEHPSPGGVCGKKAFRRRQDIRASLSGAHHPEHHRIHPLQDGDLHRGPVRKRGRNSSHPLGPQRRQRSFAPGRHIVSHGLIPFHHSLHRHLRRLPPGYPSPPLHPQSGPPPRLSPQRPGRR